MGEELERFKDGMAVIDMEEKGRQSQQPDALEVGSERRYKICRVAGLQEYGEAERA